MYPNKVNELDLPVFAISPYTGNKILIPKTLADKFNVQPHQLLSRTTYKELLDACVLQRKKEQDLRFQALVIDALRDGQPHPQTLRDLWITSNQQAIPPPAINSPKILPSLPNPEDPMHLPTSLPPLEDHENITAPGEHIYVIGPPPYNLRQTIPKAVATLYGISQLQQVDTETYNKLLHATKQHNDHHKQTAANHTAALQELKNL